MPDQEVQTPSGLAEALEAHPEAQAIWNRLSEAHRRGHLIAIQRVTDPKKKADKVRDLIEHLVEGHGH